MMKMQARTIVFLILCSCSNAAFPVEITGLDFQFVADSNPARAEFSRDIEASGTIEGRITLNLADWELTNTEQKLSGVAINSLFSYDHNLDFDLLGESRYRLSIGYFSENRNASGSPFFRFGAGIGYLDSESAIRDSIIVDVLTSLNFQITPIIDTTLGAGIEFREADTEVFDTTKGQIFLTANVSPIPRLILRSGVRYVVGNEVSTARPTYSIVNNSLEIEVDDVFSDSVENRLAYLVDANSLLLEAGLGYDISATIQANLLYRFITTDATGDIGYERGMTEFTLSYNF